MPRGRFFRGCRDNLVRLGLDLGFGSIGQDALQNLHPARVIALSAQQPARAFRKSEAKQSVEKRGKRGHAQHPAPGILANAGEQRVGHKSDQDAENNVELEHAGKPSSVFRRRDLRDVQRSRHSRNADAQAANHTRDDERGNIGRQTRPDCADKIQHANPKQRGFASESVSGPAADQRPHDGAVECGSHGNAVESGTQAP